MWNASNYPIDDRTESQQCAAALKAVDRVPIIQIVAAAADQQHSSSWRSVRAVGGYFSATSRPAPPFELPADHDDDVEIENSIRDCARVEFEISIMRDRLERHAKNDDRSR